MGTVFIHIDALSRWVLLISLGAYICFKIADQQICLLETGKQPKAMAKGV